ncbi:hypothetical protein ACO0SA_004236 [Hanseniaspora valbyensis]
MKLEDFGVNIHSFLQNTDDSSDEDIQLLYEPLSKISLPEHKKSLANLSTVDATLINNKAYLKLLFTNFFIKHKRFIRYMQDLNLFESHFDIYFHRKKDIKNEIISSVKFGDLNQWRNWLINQEYRMIEFMDNQNLNKNLEYLIKNTSFGEIFNTITYEIKRTTQESIPEITIPDDVVNEDDIINGISFGETSVNIDLAALNNKIDDYLNMTMSSPEEKTQDDWCAYNVLFKYSTNKEVNFLLSEQVFKKTNIKEFFQKIYFSNRDYEHYEEQINFKINDIKNKIDLKDEKIQKLKEENERYARILASSDLTDPLEQETSEKDTSQEPTNKVDDEVNEQDDVDMKEEQENDKEESTDLPNDNETNEDNKNENTEHKDGNTVNEAIKNEPHEYSNSKTKNSYQVEVVSRKRILTLDEDDSETSNNLQDQNKGRSSKRRRNNLNYDENGELRKVQFEEGKVNYTEPTMKLYEIALAKDKRENDFSEEEIKKEEEEIKTEYDEAVKLNTSLNNISDITDFKLLKKTCALDSEELKEKLEIAKEKALLRNKNKRKKKRSNN